MHGRNWLKTFLLIAASVFFICAVSVTPATAQDLNEALRLNGQAIELYQQGKYREAVPLAERALAIGEKALGPDDPDVARSLNILAMLYKTLGDYEKAEPLYKRSLAILEKALGPDHPDVATSLNNLAALYDTLGDYEKAQALDKRSLAIQEKASGPDDPVLDLQDVDEALRLTDQASKLYQQGRYREAVPLAERSLAIREKALGPDNLNVALSLTILAMLYETLGDYEKAEPLNKRSAAIYEKPIGPYRPLFEDLDEARTLDEQVTKLYQQGRYREAVPLAERSVAIREKNLEVGPNNPFTTTSLNNLAMLYDTLGDYRKAEPLYKRLLAIHEKAFRPDSVGVSVDLNNLAMLYDTLGDYEKAEPLLKRSLAICEKALGPDHPDVATSLNNLALLYDTLGDYRKAEPLYKRSLAIYEKAFGPDHPRTTTILNNLAVLYLETGRLEDAYAMFKRTNTPDGFGLYYLKKGDYPQAERAFLIALDLDKVAGNPHFLIADHIGLGLSYEGLKDYPRAKEHFREAIGVIEKQWQTLSPQAKKDFMAGKVGAGFSRLEPYEGMVRVILKEKGADAAKDSLAVAESVKGRVFLEMLATRQLKGNSVQSEAVLTKDRQFQEELLVLHKRIEVMEGLRIRPPRGEIDALKEQLSRKEKDYSAFIEEVKLSGAELASLLTVDPISPSKLQSLLDPATSLLEYFTAKDAAYAWLVTRDDIKVYEMPIKEKDLKERVDTFLLPNISNSSRKAEPVMVYAPKPEKGTTEKERQANRARFTGLTQAFYKDILSPIEKDIRASTLVIVPHGVLHKVPFSALSDGKSCLADRYALSVLPSASVMEYVVKKRKTAKSTILTLANPKTDYVPLGFAEQEGNAVSRLFPVSEVYVRDKATKTLAENKSPSFNVIHFACHGQFNERQPLQSGLILAKDAENDGFLQVHEIFSLDLKNANLVTLSACDTALAKIQGGDDLVGLSRGFIYAGTPSLLATLWEVDDQSTAILMESFYKNWLKGMSKPEALRQAQMKLKNMPQYRHPYYWAAFEMIGDWR